MTENIAVANRLGEWTYHEDASGIVYCLGRNVGDNTYEAVGVYERALNGDGVKQSLESEASYNRLMYHGFPEEEGKLSKMRPEIRAALIGNTSLRDRCIFIDPSDMTTADKEYRSIDGWLARADRRTAPFRESLETACAVMEQAGISLVGAELYGGVAYGLVGERDKRVDDIDILLKVDSAELHAGAQELQTAYKWDDIDPQSILSKRRQLLKVKRWSTSQIRLFDPEFLSIDLKVSRDPDQPSLWDELPDRFDPKGFEGTLRVVDDSEAYCISPAVRCEDERGNERVVLFRGYPYIGCAIAGDTIKVRGNAIEDSSVVLVTQAAEDLLVPDFSKVPIS
jgi:hypothetical protein